MKHKHCEFSQFYELDVSYAIQHKFSKVILIDLSLLPNLLLLFFATVCPGWSKKTSSSEWLPEGIINFHVNDVFERNRDRGGGGAGRTAAPPLFCAPAPTFCAKGKIIKLKKKRLETSFFRPYSAIFSVFSLISNARHFVGLLCFSR